MHPASRRRGRHRPRPPLSIVPSARPMLSNAPTPADARSALSARADTPRRFAARASQAAPNAAARRRCARLRCKPVHPDKLRFAPGGRAIERSGVPSAGQSVQQRRIQPGNQRLHDLPLQDRVNAARVGRRCAGKSRRQLVVQFDIGLEIRANADFPLA